MFVRTESLQERGRGYSETKVHHEGRLTGKTQTHLKECHSSSLVSRNWQSVTPSSDQMMLLSSIYHQLYNKACAAQQASFACWLLLGWPIHYKASKLYNGSSVPLGTCFNVWFPSFLWVIITLYSFSRQMRGWRNMSSLMITQMIVLERNVMSCRSCHWRGRGPWKGSILV